MVRRRGIVRLCVLTVGVVGVLSVMWWGDAYTREMRPVYAVIETGEQNWGTEATRLLHGIMARSSDRRGLADRLLKERDGSLVAEGMVLAVRNGHPRVRAILREHLADGRWNWALAHNDELARQLKGYVERCG
jgi:hypothetical protein